MNTTSTDFGASTGRSAAYEEMHRRGKTVLPTKHEEAQTPNAHPKVCIEYSAPHWFIGVRAGSAKWSPLYDPTKLVEVHDAFGDVVRKHHAIMSFPTYSAALTYVNQNLGQCRLVKRSAFFGGDLRRSL